MIKVKEDNEQILKDKEELNAILLPKIHNDDKGKSKEYEHEMPKTSPYKRKDRKIKFSIHKSNTSMEELVKHHRKQQDSSERSDENKKKNKYIPYEEIYGSLRKLNHPCLLGKLRRAKRKRLGCPEWKSIFKYITTQMS